MLTNSRIMVSAYFRAILQIFMKLCMNTAIGFDVRLTVHPWCK